MNIFKKRWTKYVWDSVLIIGIGLLFIHLPLGNKLRYLSYDFLYLFHNPVPPKNVIIIYMDEESHHVLDQPYDKTWNRRLHAELLNKITDQGASLVIYDIIFEMSSSNLESDVKLAEAFKRHGSVILGGSLIQKRGSLSEQQIVIPPEANFRHSIRDWGILQMHASNPRLILTGTPELESAIWKAASIVNPGLKEYTDNRLIERWINYLGPPDTFPYISFHKVYLDEVENKNIFKNKIVFIGSRYITGFTGSGKDTFLTPYSLNGYPPANGVEIHANSLVNLIEENWFNHLGREWESVIVATYGILVSLILVLLTPRIGILVAITLGLSVSILSILLSWETLTFYSWIVPAGIQTTSAYIWVIGTKYYQEIRRKIRLKKAFSAYLSPVMAQQVAESDISFSLGGELKEVTLLFTDLEGFTKLSDGSNPDEISKILNTYFNLTSHHVLQEHGTILKYIGDSVFAVWGAPLEDFQQANNAVKAALGMIESTKGRRFYGHLLRTRIGISSGTCLAGNLGSDTRFDYTVIGSEVNLASRLEGLNKYTGTDIVVSESTAKQLADAYIMRLMGSFLLVGKEKAVLVYEILGESEGEEVEPDWQKFYAEGLSLFSQREFVKAKVYFERTIKARLRGDGPSEFLLTQINMFSKNKSLPENWKGEIVITDK